MCWLGDGRLHPRRPGGDAIFSKLVQVDEGPSRASRLPWGAGSFQLNQDGMRDGVADVAPAVFLLVEPADLYGAQMTLISLCSSMTRENAVIVTVAVYG